MGQTTDLTKDRPQARHGETWQEHWERRMRQASYPGDIPVHRGDPSRGDQTKPAEPQGTSPLDRDQRSIDKSR
jgi:hypothetical protein